MLSDKNVLIEKNSFVIKNRDQILVVEEWGRNSVRVKSAPNHSYDFSDNYGIEELEKNGQGKVQINQYEDKIELINDDLKVEFDGEKLSFYNNKLLILEEFSRKQSNVRRTIGIDDHIPIKDMPTSSLNISPREYRYLSNDKYESTLRFEGDENEKIYGMGGYQEDNLNKNLNNYELMQRNSQTSIPFYISNKNYGFIWNNASIGEVSFGKKQIVLKSFHAQCIDYVVTVGANPKHVMDNFTEMIGKPPMMDNSLLGLWQSKLRYQTIDEIKAVYNEYKKRNIPLSVLVIDYFHWTADGDYEFDMNYWMGIEEFAEEVKKDGTQLMVSIWPTVSYKSKYYNEYKKNQMLIRSVNKKDNVFGWSEILDFSHPKTVEHFNTLIRKNYEDLGIKLFWADQAEPEMSYYNHDEYLLYKGSLEKIGNKYPYYYIRAIQHSEDNVFDYSRPTLIRSAWFNSQKYGALAWSGDIESSFESLKRQIQVSVNMGISGIPWWTSDIGGFHSGDSSSDNFKELIIRWYQFSVFSPILRMHGDRQPHTQRIGDSGGGGRTSGGPNELWSFGEEVENILTKFTIIRENLKKYISRLYEESHKSGYPIIRSIFMEYPEDPMSWEETTNYMFGSDLFIAPVTEMGVRGMSVYLPKGSKWINVFNKMELEGGQAYKIEIQLDEMAVFCRVGSELEEEIDSIF